MRTGYEKVVLIIAKILSKINSENEVKIFSIGPVSKKTIVDNWIEQQIVKGISYPETGMGPFRAFDFISLYALGVRPSIRLLNRNAAMINAISVFKPDLIITGSVQTYGIINKYKSLDKNVKVIEYTDTPRAFEDSFNSIDYVRIPKGIREAIKKRLKRKYMGNMLGIFEELLKLSDAIVVPTSIDKADIIERFNVKGNNIFPIPSIFADVPKTKPRSKKISGIKTILFVGVCKHTPNEEANSCIEKKIAPKLPHKRFLIAGSGCQTKVKGNVEYLGHVKDLKKLIASVDLCIAPMTSNTGMKTRFIDYFVAGKVVLGTRLAFTGYPVKNGVDVIIEDNVDNFYKRIRELDENKALIERIQTNSIKVADKLSFKALSKKWEKVIEYITAN